MNILIISAQNPYKVSGVVALNLYLGLKKRGNNIKLLVNTYGKYDDPAVTCMQTYSDVLFTKVKNRSLKLLNRFFNVIRKKDPDYSIQDLYETKEHYKTKDILNKADFKPDVILYLFPQNFLNAKNLYELNKLTGAPIYWYLMDSAALTGGCHYSWDCMRFTTGCGKCPGLLSDDENDQTAINFKFKNKYISKTDVTIISATEWQYRLGLKSLLFREKAMEKILLSVDPATFSPASKNEVRKKLGIPADKKVIFFGATYLRERRKGMKYLAEALVILKNSGKCADADLLLLVAGYDFELIKDALPYEYKYVGLLANNEQLAEAFQLCDLYVCPSVEDSGPMMINQALMCGIPTVAFEMGVAMDIIITGETGYRAKLMDSNDLAKGIETVLSLTPAEYDRYSKNCRELSLKSFTPEVQIEQFEKLFKQ